MIKTSLLFLLFLVLCGADQKCVSRDYGNGGTVCVCTSEYCDTITSPEKVEAPQYLKYTSNLAGLRFELEKGSFQQLNTTTNEIFVSSKETFQKILGWGGAFTDSTGINIKSLDKGAQNLLLESYFSDKGIGYSLCRVPIGGTDFSLNGYSYDDGDADPELVNFKLADEDFQYKIPFIKRALNLTNGNLKFFASAWTAPKWMKTNGEYAGYGFLIKDMYQPWANYFVKFLDNYKEEGIEFWGMTTGNEPNTAYIPFDKINTVGWTPEDQGAWIADNLGPTIRNSNHSDINLMILDDQRMHLPEYINRALANSSISSYIDGIAVHWYTDFIIPASRLSETHELYSDKFILSTEACGGYLPSDEKVLLGSWERGEQYSHDIIEDLMNWVGGWVDWNMALDLTGGPTYINNFVDSPIIVNFTAGEFYKQPMFYHLGHFSKFVPRDSVRITSNTNLDISVVALRKPDDGIAVVILNKNDVEIPATVVDDSRGSAEVVLTARSITTLLYW